MSLELHGDWEGQSIPPDLVAGGYGSITLASGAKFRMAQTRYPVRLQVDLADGAEVEIGGDLSCNDLVIYGRNHARLTIGAVASFNGRVRLLMHERARMTIGTGALFGSDTDVTLSDMHSVIDVASGLRVNWAADVLVGPRVWVGQRCMILKGSAIGEGSVIGAGSVVSGDIPPFSLAAGSPARVMRGGITWDFRLL